MFVFRSFRYQFFKLTSFSVESNIVSRAFRLYDFKIFVSVSWSLETSKTEIIVFNIVFNSIKSIDLRFQSFRFKFDFKKSIDWFSNWKQSRVFARVVRNFCNVITVYRDSKYFKKLIRTSRQFFSSNDFVAFSFSDTPSKSKLSELANPFVRVSRISRRNKSIANIENVSIRFDLRSTSSQTLSYSFVTNSFSRRVTSVTSVNEIIHHEFIESQLQSTRNMIDFIVKQQRIIVVIVRKVIQTISRERDDDDDDAESFDSSEFLESSNQNDENTDNNIKWNFANLDFFDFYYDDKSLANEVSFIVNTEKNIYFKNVHLFIVRAKKMIFTRDDQLVKDNLWFSLKNIALKWWTNELFDVERRMIKMTMIEQEELFEWISLLHDRFKQSINVVMNNLMQQRYILRNVVTQREFREYAQKIIRLVKNAEMISVLNQLNFIYNGIDIDVRVDTLRRSKNNIIINEMLSDMNEFKHDWWIKAVKFRSNINDQNNQNSRNQLFRQNVRSQQFDQYNNSTRQSQSQRQSFQSQRQSFQSFQFRYQNNAYQNQFFQQFRQNYQQTDYQQVVEYQNYKSIDYQVSYSNQNQYSNVRTLFISSNRFQITVDSTNVNASNSNQQQFMSSRQFFKSLNNNQRNDYDDNEYAQRFQTTYQISVFDETNENNYIVNDINDVHWLFEYSDIDDNALVYDDHSNLLDDYNQNVETIQDVNFFAFVAKTSDTTHSCNHCSDTFTFRNQLFKHLRNACWFDIFEQIDYAIFVIKLSFIVSIFQKNSNVEIFREKIYELSHVFFSISRRVIKFIVRFDETSSDYAFREYQYDQTTVKLNSNTENIKICIDIDCFVTMIDRKFLTQLLSNVSMQKLISFISVRDVEDKIVKSNEYMFVNMSFDDLFKSKQTTIDVIETKMHFIDDFAVNMLLANDVIYSQNIKIDFEKRRLTIVKCENLRVSIEIFSRTISNVKRIIRSRQTYILMSDDLAKMFVIYHDSLSDDRDFLFEFHCQYDLEYDDDVYVHFVDNNLSKILIRNVTFEFITLTKRTRLNMIIEYNQAECYLIMSEKSYKTASDWMNDRSWKKQFVVNFVIFVATYVILNITSQTSFSFIASFISTSSNVASTEFASAMSIVSQIDFSLKHVLFSDVTVYEAKMFELVNLMNSYQNIFQNFDFIVDIFEKKWIFINFKTDAMPKFNKMYFLNAKDRSFIDVIFDKLHQQNKLHWTIQSIAFSYSVFVVWRDTSTDQKKRVVINIKDLNDIIENDNYSLSLQFDIIAEIVDSFYIFIIDVVNWFHQFNVQRKNRHKFTIVIHREQKKFNVVFMNYKNSLSYVQRQTNKLLRSYKQFAKTYVNDIIVHFKILQKHLKHLRTLFQMFRIKRISLAITKFFLTYSSVTLLNQRVDSLDMFIIVEKIVVIISFRFSFSLRDFEIFMKFIDWLRSSIFRYAQRVQSLQKRKITLIKNVTVSDSARKRQTIKTQLYDFTHEKRVVFRNLQIAFVFSIFLIHFDRKRRLYIDLNAFKQWNFATIVYHVLNDSFSDVTYSRTTIQSIMFFNRCLNDVEKNYWSTKLKIVDIVWVIRKIKHMIESTEIFSIIIYIDHFVAVSINRQIIFSIFNSDKLNLRLMRVSQYLFDFNLSVKHKVDKANVMSNVLFKLQTDVIMTDKIDVLESLYEHILKFTQTDLILKTSLYFHHVILIEMSNDFKIRFKQTYQNDQHWFKIFIMIRFTVVVTSITSITIETIVTNVVTSATNEIASIDIIVFATTFVVVVTSEIYEFSDFRDVRFRYKNDLLYYISDFVDSKRLCIFAVMKIEMFRQIHDFTHHDDFMRTYDKLRNSIYVHSMIKHFKVYIVHCSECQINQIKRHSIYDEFTFIISSTIFFHTIVMNFIVKLSFNRDMNVLLTITCKFSKKILLISNHDIWIATNWTNVVIVVLIEHDWNISHAIVSNRDSKFMSNFWQTVFNKFKTIIFTFTVYHSQTNEQSKRINQIIEIALRFHVTTHSNDEWIEILSFFQIENNNVVHAIIGYFSNELVYEFKINDTLNMLADLFPENYSQLRQIKRENVEVVMTFVNVFSKVRYDEIHKTMKFKIDDKMYLRLHHDYIIFDLFNHKLAKQRVRSFSIIEKIDNFVFRLQLFSIMKIHSVISIAQLKSITSNSDSYDRTADRKSLSIQKKQFIELTELISLYEIERLLNRRIISTNRINYLVKWKNYDSKHNVWYFLHALDTSKNLVDVYDLQHSIDQINEALETREKRDRNRSRNRFREAKRE